MARQDGKFIFIGDIHASMPAAERLRRRALMDMALQTAADREEPTVLVGDRIEGPFVPEDHWPDALRSDEVTSYACGVRDRLCFFLDSVDKCDVLFQDRDGERLVFLIATDAQDHLELICRTIASESKLLRELGVDPKDVNVDQGMIRMLVPLPEAMLVQ